MNTLPASQFPERAYFPYPFYSLMSGEFTPLERDVDTTVTLGGLAYGCIVREDLSIDDSDPENYLYIYRNRPSWADEADVEVSGNKKGSTLEVDSLYLYNNDVDKELIVSCNDGRLRLDGNLSPWTDLGGNIYELSPKKPLNKIKRKVTDAAKALFDYSVQIKK